MYTNFGGYWQNSLHCKLQTHTYKFTTDYQEKYYCFVVYSYID